MSGIGFWELIFLFLVGLVVLGPERLPRVANQLGSWVGQARRMSRVLRRQLEDELSLEKEQKQEQKIRPPPQIPPTGPESGVEDSSPQGPDSAGSGAVDRTSTPDTEFSDTDVLDENGDGGAAADAVTAGTDESRK